VNSYNEERKAKGIVEQLRKGKKCALVTSAGTPCISDPGNHLVRKCYEEGIEVISIPGPSAAVGAVSISGLFADRFLFFGFLPQKKGKQKKILLELAVFPYPIIFYESPRRLIGTLENMYDVFGNRQTVIVKEMTKVHEKVYRGQLHDLLEAFPEDEIKGEFTVIIDGKGKNAL
jgi:16S rRNA (cytidine1402-2'-O)-methyltransferase